MAFLDLLCIGAQKAGTTWLHSMLSQHPDVFRAPLSECHYFNFLQVPVRTRPEMRHKGLERRRKRRAIRRERRAKRIKKVLIKRIEAQKSKAADPNAEKIAWLESLAEDNRILTADWYKELFAGPGSEGKIRFEKTPAYSALPLWGIRQVKSLLGAIPIIFIIRDPVNRMLSQLRTTASRRLETEPISESDWHAVLEFMPERGDYMTYITRWLSVFPENNIHFIPFQRIPKQPDSVMRFVEDLVSLPPYEYRNPRGERSSKKKIEVPQSVIDRVTEHVAPQYVFLEQHFGKEFVRQI